MLATNLVGHQVGNYVVTRKLGEGGMGLVYEAVHPTIDRKVAIKVILPELTHDDQVVARFIREGRAANQVGSVGLVEVYDLGRLPSGELYLVMEFLAGETVDDRVRRAGRFSLEDSMDVLDACGSALGALHDAGMVHRDLKPENIFLLDSCARSIKILDFGLVKLLDERDAARTASGAVMGTPLYMAPEQCQGSKDLDARTDVYAMGCVLYFMLAGRPPFEASTPAQALLAHIMEPPPSIAAVRPEVPASIDAILARALAKEPAGRFSSVGELARATRDVVGGRLPAATTLCVSNGEVGAGRAKGRSWSAFALAALLVLVATAMYHRGRRSDLVSTQAAVMNRPQVTAETAGATVPAAVAASADTTRDEPVMSDAPQAASSGDPVAAAPERTGEVARAAVLEGRREWRSRSYQDAFAWFRRACELGDPAGCENAMHAIPRGGVAEDEWDIATMAIARRCPENTAACLASAVLEGKRDDGVTACDAGVPSGCLVVAAKSHGEARTYWTQRGVLLLDDDLHVDAGYVRGVIHVLGSHPDEGRVALARACDEGDRLSCELLGCLSFDSSASRRRRSLDICEGRGLVGQLLYQVVVEE